MKINRVTTDHATVSADLEAYRREVIRAVNLAILTVRAPDLEARAVIAASSAGKTTTVDVPTMIEALVSVAAYYTAHANASPTRVRERAEYIRKAFIQAHRQCADELAAAQQGQR
jgi:hypothetical protein